LRKGGLEIRGRKAIEIRTTRFRSSNCRKHDFPSRHFTTSDERGLFDCINIRKRA